jgi:NDP-sugar pyrophosphorylase family protein
MNQRIFMKPTLLVLAAGLGTRYGGLKQIDAIGPYGETIIDYSIYDAMRAGFGKVVFVIRHYFEEAFREKVSRKFDRFVEAAYAYQELDAGLGSFSLPPERDRPWGTGHAILVGREVIQEPFAVVNADDYYGRRSLQAMVRFLTDSGGPNDYAMVGYTLKNTLSEHGTVARGVTECDENMFLKRVIERTGIEKTADSIRYFDPDGTPHSLTGDEPVSMNLWGFQPSIFEFLQLQFARFLAERGQEKNAELYIPFVVDKLVTGGAATVKVLRTDEPWFGITYRADKSLATARIRQLIDQGIYPERLWGR